jgi:hypothetical protein
LLRPLIQSATVESTSSNITRFFTSKSRRESSTSIPRGVPAANRRASTIRNPLPNDEEEDGEPAPAATRVEENVGEISLSEMLRQAPVLNVELETIQKSRPAKPQGLRHGCEIKRIRKKRVGSRSFYPDGAIGGYTRQKSFGEPFDHGDLLGHGPSPLPVASHESRIQKPIRKLYKKIRGLKIVPGCRPKSSEISRIPETTPEHLRVHRPRGVDKDKTEIQFLRRTSFRPSGEEREKRQRNEEALKRLRERAKMSE